MRGESLPQRYRDPNMIPRRWNQNGKFGKFFVKLLQSISDSPAIEKKRGKGGNDSCKEDFSRHAQNANLEITKSHV